MALPSVSSFLPFRFASQSSIASVTMKAFGSQQNVKNLNRKYQTKSNKRLQITNQYQVI